MKIDFYPLPTSCFSPLLRESVTEYRYTKIARRFKHGFLYSDIWIQLANHPNLRPHPYHDIVRNEIRFCRLVLTGNTF